MFELMDSKGNRFLLSRHHSASNKSSSNFSRLLIKHLLRDCDSLSLQKAYRALLGSYNGTNTPNYWHATLSPQGTLASEPCSSTLKASSPNGTLLSTTEEKLFAAIANGSIKIQQTHKAAKGSNSQAQKGFALSSTKLRNTLHALTQQSTNNPQQHWQLQSQSSGPESERLKQFYKRFLVQNQSSSSSPSNNEASGISAQQREILLALGFVPHKISSERYAQTQSRCHQLWRTTELVKLLDGFVSRYGTSNLNVELGGPGHIDPCARLEIAQRLLLAAEAEPNALQSPSNIPSLGTFKKAGKALQDAIDISQSLSKEKQETGSAMNLSDLASDDSDVPANNAPPTALTFIEITLLDHEGEPVANEPYWIRDPEGNEYTGNTDGSGMARVDSIKPGMCQVSFPERDGGSIGEPTHNISNINSESTNTHEPASNIQGNDSEPKSISQQESAHNRERKAPQEKTVGPPLSARKGIPPSSLDNAEDRLKSMQSHITADGYKPKYSDNELIAQAQSGNLVSERYHVRFMEKAYLNARETPSEDLSGKLGQVMKGETGTGAKYWSTTFDQIEDADTDAKLISEKLGLGDDYKPDGKYVMVIIDTEKANPLTGVTSVPATFERVGEFANKEFGDAFPVDFTQKVMSSEFQTHYAYHYNQAVEQKVLPWAGSRDSKKFSKYLNSTDLSDTDKELLIQRMSMHDKIGNNQDYVGNGVTKDMTTSSNNYGAVETLNFERQEINLKQLDEAGAIKILDL